MTSTSFNIGFSETKSSSRVLKPPGGGHTDIFGIVEDNEIQTPNKRRNQPPTTITSCFDLVETTKTENVDKDIEKNGNENGTNENIGDENAVPKFIDNEIDVVGKEKNENDQQTAAPKRVRVPPGGFSSGFW